MNTDKKLVLLAVAVLILIGVVGGVQEYRTSVQHSSPFGTDNDGTDAGVVCAADAMLCPDGTYVGRSGPRCEFVCPNNTGTAATTSETTGAGTPGGPRLTGALVGTVKLGPMCPVIQNPPSDQCADRPYVTTVVVSTNGKEVGRQQTDAQGNFTFSFLPGTYAVTALGGTSLPHCQPESVELKKATTTVVTIYCDTGIR